MVIELIIHATLYTAMN